MTSSPQLRRWAPAIGIVLGTLGIVVTAALCLGGPMDPPPAGSVATTPASAGRRSTPRRQSPPAALGAGEALPAEPARANLAGHGGEPTQHRADLPPEGTHPGARGSGSMQPSNVQDRLRQFGGPSGRAAASAALAPEPP